MQTEKIFNNRYRVDGVLGTGGMALVYCGTDTLLRRRVAIKVLRDQYAEDDDFVKRFSYEAQSAAKLSHPNIVNVYDFGRENDAYYIVMELVDGATLGELMRDEHVLPELTAVDYAIQIASGLAYAHRQGLLHRDIKPANILVTKDDVVKLSDFGIARAVSEHTLGVTQPGMVMGSVAYISPEQAQGHEIDERSDLYAAGVVLYQMLTGALPFTGDTPVAVALKHVSEPAPAIDTKAPGISPAVAAIVARLLRKDPAERFSSATELASALRDARERPHVAHDGFADAPTSRTPVVQPPPRRSAAPDLAAAGVAESSHPEHRGVDPRWIVMPLLLVLAIAIGFFALRGAPVFPPPNAIAVPDFTNVSGSVAAQRLEALGLRAQPTEEPSETIRQGYVVRQDPAPGAKLAKDAAVALVISAGLPRVQIPDVKGYSAPDAQRALQAAKLKSKIAAQTYSATVPAGQVLDVSPAVGSSVRENSVVALTVSKGVHPVSVPSIVSLKVAEARRRLAALGLTLTVGQQTESEAVPQDEIASQDPAAGTSVDPKSAVTVIVSTGPPAATVPNVVGADPDQAQQTLRSAGFVPTVTYNVDATNATQKVSAQRPDAGTSAKKSSSVTIFVSVPGTVPDVTGMTLDEAKKTLVAAGYQIGSTAYTADETPPGGSVQDGQVVRTEPEAGKPLTPGESVNITVMRSGASNGAPGGDGDGGRR